MTTATKPERLFKRKIELAPNARFTLIREDDDGAESIFGLVPAGQEFGSWKPGADELWPAADEVQTAASELLGFPVEVDGIKAQDDGSVKIAFVRAAEKPADAQNGEPPAAQAPADQVEAKPLDPPTKGHASDEEVRRQHLWEKRIKTARKKVAEAIREQASAESEMEEARGRVKSAKASLDQAMVNLCDAVDGKPHQEQLPFPSENGAKPAAGAAPAQDDSWKATLLAELGLSDAILKKLADAELTTVGQLQTYVEKKGQEGYSVPLTTIKGIKGATLEKIDAAMQEFWAKRGQSEQAAAAEEPATIEKDIEKVLEAESDADADAQADDWHRSRSLAPLGIIPKGALGKLKAAGIETLGQFLDCGTPEARAKVEGVKEAGWRKIDAAVQGYFDEAANAPPTEAEGETETEESEEAE